MRSMHVIAATAFLVSSLLAVAGVTNSSSPFATRAEAVRFLLEKGDVDVPDIPSGSELYPDVSSDSWYAKFMVVGAEEGLVEPQQGTRLLFPDRLVTRGEFLTMIAALYELPENLPHHFKDIPKNAPYAPFVGVAQDWNLFDFVDAKRFEPETLVTKREMSDVFSILIGLPFLSSAGYDSSFSSGFSAYSTASSLPRLPIAEEDSSAGSASFSLPITIAEEESSLPEEPPPHIVVPEKTVDPEKMKTELLALINAERAKYDLPALKRNSLLNQAAQNHAQDMEKRKYFDHFSPEGFNYIDRIEKTGYFTSSGTACSCKPSDLTRIPGPIFDSLSTSFLANLESRGCSCLPHFTAGENLAKGQRSADIVVGEWMNSPPHRKAILQSFFVDVGIGFSGDVWVVNFGSVTFW